MNDKPKKTWTTPTLRRLEPGDELLKMMASAAREVRVPTTRTMK